METEQLNSARHPLSVKLWPPTQNTRLMLVERLMNNLSTPTFFTVKYGSLSKDEAQEKAKYIEEVSFTTANQHHEKEPHGDGGSAVQLYAKECSKLILESLRTSSATKVEEEVPISEVAYDKCFDISKGPRAFIEPEEAEELLQPLKESGNSYTKICFSNRSFGLGAARVAEPILASLKGQLEEVDLSDFIAGRSEAEAIEVMKIFSAALEGCVLKSLDLSNNALGEKGVRAFGAVMKSQNSLEELYLMNDGISEEAARAICELVPSTEKLRVLHFHNNMTGDEGALAIAEVVKRSPLLEDFRCSSTRVDSEGGVVLSEALKLCTHLKKLDLRDNMFGVEAGVALSKAISSYSYLKELYLSYLNLEDEGTIAIATGLNISSPLLEVLEMAGNDISPAAVPSLTACLAEKQFLAQLNLAENELKDEGAVQIAKSLEEGHAHIKELDMSTNSIRRAGARMLAQVMVQKPEFKLLNINGNFISNDGIDDLKDIFKKSLHMLGPLDENDPEGGDDDDEGEVNDKESVQEADGDVDGELESKLKKLDVNEDKEEGGDKERVQEAAGAVESELESKLKKLDVDEVKVEGGDKEPVQEADVDADGDLESKLKKLDVDEDKEEGGDREPVQEADGDVDGELESNLKELDVDEDKEERGDKEPLKEADGDLEGELESKLKKLDVEEDN